MKYLEKFIAISQEKKAGDFADAVKGLLGLNAMFAAKAKPLLIVRMPKNGIVRITPPEVFRGGFVFLLTKLNT